MGVISASGVVTILFVAIIVVVATGFTPARSRLLDGGAWLTDDTNMPHASGPNAAVDAAVQACPNPDDCRWVQRDGLAYLLQPNAGQVYRLDTTTRHFDRQAVGIGGRGSRLLVGTGRVYSIDESKQTITSRDPLTLAPRGEPITPNGGAGDAMVDRGGALWVIEKGTGNLLGIDDASVHFTIPISSGAGQKLSLGSIDDTPVVLDPAGRTIVSIDDRGRESHRVGLSTLAADRVVLARDLAAGPLYLIEKGSGRIGRLSLDTGAVEIVGQLNVGDDVNAFYVVGLKAFAVQPDAHSVQWMSLEDRSPKPPMRDATEVFVKDSYLFVNDVHAREALVAGPDTDPQKVLKRRDDIPKGEVPVEVNNYSPTPPSVTTTTTPEQKAAAERAATSTTSSTVPPASTSSTSSTTFTIPDAATSTTLPAVATPPAAPNNVTASASDSQATIKWNASLTGLDHFEIEPASDSASFTTQTIPTSVCGGGDCTTTLKGLTNGNTYKFVVYAVDLNRTRSLPSNPSNAVTPDADLPGDPGNIAAVGKARTKVHVSWSAASTGPGGRTIVEYIVQPLNENKQDVGAAVHATTLETDVDVPSPAPAKYYFRVQAKNNGDKVSSGALSSQLVGPYGPPPQVVLNPPSTADCNKQPDDIVSIPVSWAAITPEPGDANHGYKVVVNGSTVAQSLPDPAFTIDVAAGRESSISVAAFNESGDGVAGTAQFVCTSRDPAATLSPPALQLSVDSVTPTQAQISVTQLSRPTGTDPPRAGGPCCFVDLSDPTIYLTNHNISAPLDPQVQPPIPSNQLLPGLVSTAILDITGLPDGTYTAELRDSSNNVLGSVTFGNTTTTSNGFEPSAVPPSLVAAEGQPVVRRDDSYNADLRTIRRNEP